MTDTEVKSEVKQPIRTFAELRETYEEIEEIHQYNKQLKKMIEKDDFPNESTQNFYQLPLNKIDMSSLYRDLIDSLEKCK